VVQVAPIADALGEANETVALTLVANASYAIGTTSPVVGTIEDDDVQVEGAGGVKMVKDGNQKFYAQVGSGTPVALMYGETQLFEGIFGGWETVGVETVGGANLVMWKNLGGNYVHQWMMDANWALVAAQGAWGLATVEAMAQESLFGQDFNGDWSGGSAGGNSRLRADGEGWQSKVLCAGGKWNSRGVDVWRNAVIRWDL
jgi:hypothetical protein